MKEVIYYNGAASVCLLLDETSKEVVARGVSLCSPTDQFVRKVGRAKAIGRAKQAFERQCSVEEISSKQKWLSPYYNFYGSYKPELVSFEKKLIAKFVES